MNVAAWLTFYTFDEAVLLVAAETICCSRDIFHSHGVLLIVAETKLVFINTIFPTSQSIGLLHKQANNLIYLKGYETTQKEPPPAAAWETLPNVATKLESTAQCRTVPVPPITVPPKMSKSWLIREAAQYLGKIKETVGEKKGAYELSTTYLIGRVHGLVWGRKGLPTLKIKLS